MNLDLDALLKHFAKLVAVEVAALHANGNGNGNGHQPPDIDIPSDKLITVEEAARRLSLKARWIYTHADELKFVVRLPGSRSLRCSERGIARWLARRTGQ